MTTTSPDRSAIHRIWIPGILATVVAAAVTTGTALIAAKVGVSFAVDGEAIPWNGFAFLTTVFSLVGVIIAAVLDRTAKQPRSTFVRTTVILLVLSYVPDFLAGFDVPTAATLIVLHTLAAAIVIPVLARGLRA